jgi:hypothetical protein
MKSNVPEATFDGALLDELRERLITGRADGAALDWSVPVDLC